jgi:hypothetical protein
MVAEFVDEPIQLVLSFVQENPHSSSTLPRIGVDPLRDLWTDVWDSTR